MLTDTLLEDPRWDALGLEDLAEQAGQAALIHLGLVPEDWEIAVLGCDDARIAVLNEDFRGKPQPTNVLSWPAWDLSAEVDGATPDPVPTDEDNALGDIAISYETCLKEAQESGKTPAHHVTHLVVHGTLHLLGYDHDRDGDATLMERLEREILGKMGIQDPYEDRQDRPALE